MKKNTKITATQNTTDNAAHTSCPSIGETLPASDILICEVVSISRSAKQFPRKIRGPLKITWFCLRLLDVSLMPQAMLPPYRRYSTCNSPRRTKIIQLNASAFNKELAVNCNWMLRKSTRCKKYPVMNPLLICWSYRCFWEKKVDIPHLSYNHPLAFTVPIVFPMQTSLHCKANWILNIYI